MNRYFKVTDIFRVEFVVGNKPVPSFSMIERHFFKNDIIKSFDFNFGFCLPNSRNTIEHIYEMPELSEAQSNFNMIFLVNTRIL